MFITLLQHTTEQKMAITMTDKYGTNVMHMITDRIFFTPKIDLYFLVDDITVNDAFQFVQVYTQIQFQRRKNVYGTVTKPYCRFVR